MPEINHLLVALIRIYFRQPNSVSTNFVIRVIQNMFSNTKHPLGEPDRLKIDTERYKQGIFN